MTDKPIAAGKSSFSLMDTRVLFSEIGLTKNITLLDLACGNGAYALAASSHMGRMSPDDLKDILEPFDLLPVKTIDIGERLYVSIYYGA